MSKLGHNERSYRLDVLAEEARKGLQNVEKGEEFTIGGWLAYGHALNEGRALFPGDREFGEWVVQCNLHLLAENGLKREAHAAIPCPEVGTAEVSRNERAAAMWAAANADQFEEARKRGNPRTIRGIHSKWKEIEAEREAERFAEEQRQAAEARKAAQEPAPALVISEMSAGSKPDQEEHRPQEHDKLRENPAIGDTEHQPDAADQEPVQEAAPDPHAKLRREFRSLTPEAQEDDWIGLRSDVEDLRKRTKSQTSLIADLKRELKELTGDDKTEVIRRLQAAVKNEANAKWKALEDRDAYHRQVHALKKRVDELEKMGVAY